MDRVLDDDGVSDLCHCDAVHSAVNPEVYMYLRLRLSCAKVSAPKVTISLAIGLSGKSVTISGRSDPIPWPSEPKAVLVRRHLLDSLISGQAFRDMPSSRAPSVQSPGQKM